MGSCLYQTVGQGMIAFIARTQAPDVPFYRKVIDGTTSVCLVMGGRIGPHGSHQTFMVLPSLGSIRLDHHDHLQDGALNRLVNLYRGRGGRPDWKALR